MGVKAEVGILNSIVAACAHSGQHVQARAVFDAMPSHDCQPDAVTFANLIRAYKKARLSCPNPPFPSRAAHCYERWDAEAATADGAQSASGASGALL